MVRLVPESEAYPEEVRYSRHFGSYDGGTIHRYDIAHATKSHERHTPNGTDEVEFTGWRELVARFRNEVMEHERQHSN